MKSKIFISVISILIATLFANAVHDRLITRDFDNYVGEIKKDQLFWIVAACEGNYSGGSWDKRELSDTIHWAMMNGLDIKVLDADGEEVVSSRAFMKTLSHSMKHHMEGLFNLKETAGKFLESPLYSGGRRIGTLLSRAFQKKEIFEKETVFKNRARHFLYISLLIDGLGVLVLALFLTLYLSKPITGLKDAAEKISKGDFGARIISEPSDELGRLARTFNMMAESLQREENLRKHLMTNITHELRTPLTIMKSQVEAMADGIIENREKGLENISAEIERLIKLVRGIEDITRAEASFFTKSVNTEINLGEFIKNLAEEMLPAFRAKGLEIRLENRGDIFVSTDAEKLEVILRNIVSNALKYTEKGGVRLDYGLCGDSPGFSPMSKSRTASPKWESFSIMVEDSGKGIAADNISRIFDRFYRAEESGAEGLGLGLSIVKELVDVMGGRVEVKSEIGRGSTFKLYLPSGAE